MVIGKDLEGTGRDVLEMVFKHMHERSERRTSGICCLGRYSSQEFLENGLRVIPQLCSV
jgi:hypothetical protein